MLTQRMEDSISALAKDAARRPEKVGPYMQFLVTANEAARTATPEQRALMRAYTRAHPGGIPPEDATQFIERVMGWQDTGAPGWHDQT
jgi:hypothetical protein